MNFMYPYCADIRLHVKGRISEEDAARQDRTARDILKRLSKQPGLILADEVGMGKTFVALAVAVSVALENRGKRPVVVMVPSSLKDKWPAAYKFLKAYKMTNDQQGPMAMAVEIEGKAVSDVAKAWVDSKQAVWQPWVDAATK